MISEKFSYNKQKVIQALRYHFISRPEIKWMIILVNVFAVISAALYFMKKVTPMAFLVSSVLWVALMISFWYVMPMMIYRNSKTFKDEFKAILNDDEFGIQHEKGSRQWKWNEFSEFIETPHFFHLYFNPRSFFLLPKEAFPGDEEHQARTILKEKIKKA